MILKIHFGNLQSKHARSQTSVKVISAALPALWSQMPVRLQLPQGSASPAFPVEDEPRIFSQH